MTDRWSAENIAKTRLENLAKAREARKKIQENSRQPFTVTPIVEAVKEEPPNPKVTAIEEDAESQEEAAPSMLSQLSQAGYSVFLGFSGLALTMAFRLVVEVIRDSILQPPPKYDSPQPSSNKPSNHNYVEDFRNGMSDRDIIFRKV